MASGTSNMMGFYRQKKTGGVSKKPSSKTLTKNNSSPSHATAALGSDLPDDRDWEKGEMVLKHFDMDVKYGPCVGMMRMDRWERARRLGLDRGSIGIRAMEITEKLENLILSLSKQMNASFQAIWDGMDQYSQETNSKFEEINAKVDQPGMGIRDLACARKPGSNTNCHDT